MVQINKVAPTHNIRQTKRGTDKRSIKKHDNDDSLPTQKGKKSSEKSKKGHIDEQV